MKLDNICNQVYVVALNEARMQNHEYLTPEHFLYAALMFELGKDIISKSGGDPEAIQKELSLFFEEHVPSQLCDCPVDSFEFVRMLELATAQVSGSGKHVVILGNLLAAMFNLPHSHAAYIMRKNGVDRLALLRVISHEIEKPREERAAAPPKPAEGGATAADNEAFLNAYVVDLTQKAREGRLDALIGREDILERTVQVLSRRLKNNPVHVGDPGVGKTAIVEGLAQRIADGRQNPGKLLHARLLMLDMGLVVAGTKYRGDFEERLIKLMDIISALPNPIVYLDEIHTVVGAGAVSGGGLDATSIIKPYLAKGHIKFIGSTTFEEYKKYLEKDRALSRRFQRIDVSEPSLDECAHILMGVKEKYERYHHVSYGEDVVRLACELAAKHIRDRFMPDKAIDVLDETGAFLRMSRPLTQPEEPIPVTEKDIERTVAQMAKIPEKSVSGNENEKLRLLRERMCERVFGQDDAVASVVNAIKAARSGLNDAEKPVASLLFVGPTGVGKTEIARQLASLLDIRLLRFDMSEYQEKHSVARLIGAPPGYVGYEEGGLLTEAVRKTPHCVLLLDEIEKAHPDIFNVLLQIMDYGALTDNEGKTAGFHNVILIMTSNAGAKEIGKRVIGFDGQTMSADAIDKEVERIFSPEFRNRLDETVVFRHVDEEMARLIAIKAVGRLAERLKDKNVAIRLTDDALAHIAAKGFSEKYGAREIIRVVENDVKKLLVDEVLFGKLARGGSATVDVKDNRIVIRARKARASVAGAG